MEQNQFYYDDFFIAENDPGIERKLKINGREIPIYFKRALSLDDINGAKAVAIKTKMNLKSGQMELLGIDENKFMSEIMFRAIISWPFIERSGKHVPITRENIGRLVIDGGTALMEIVAELIGRKQDTSFFENPSEEVS